VRLVNALLLRYRYDRARQEVMLCAGMTGQWQTYRLELVRGRWAVACPGGRHKCSRRAEVLYFPFVRGADRPDQAGLCRHCCGMRMLSEDPPRASAALRADLKMGSRRSVADALSGGGYLAARWALEKEGITARRIFTRADGRSARFGYLNQE